MAHTFYEVPLTGAAQKFQITLANVKYQMQLQYRNAVNGGWFLDIFDILGNSIAAGIPLVTGADLLAQLRHLGIGGGLMCSTDGNPDAVPTYANLGSTSHLYFVTTP